MIYDNASLPNVVPVAKSDNRLEAACLISSTSASTSPSPKTAYFFTLSPWMCNGVLLCCPCSTAHVFATFLI